MDPKEALDNLDQVAQQARATRQDHEILKESVTTLRELIEESQGPAEDRTALEDGDSLEE